MTTAPAAIDAAEFRAGVRDAAARSWQVRKRLKVPKRDTIHPTVLGDQGLAPDVHVAGRAAQAALLICDDWPLGETTAAALVVAAGRAAVGSHRPVTALYDPRLTAWITDHLEETT